MHRLRTHSLFSACLLMSILMINLLTGGCSPISEIDRSPQAVNSLEIKPTDLVKPEEGKSDSSTHALFLEFAFEGKVRLNSSYWPERSIEQQLLYTVGQLNGNQAVGRLDKLNLTDIQETRLEDGGFEIKYHARLTVAWSKANPTPSTYEFILPYDGTFDGLDRFTANYMTRCVDFGAHDVDSGSMWYYYRPNQARCELKEDEIVRTQATVKLSESMTTGKYPEYHQVWKDQTLRAIAIFGKAKEEGDSIWDAGFGGYRTFYGLVTRLLYEQYQATLKVTPEIDLHPTLENDHIMIETQLDDGRSVELHLFLVDNIRTTTPEFNEQYRVLSQSADLIIYNGHAGLGANIRALARKGEWTEGQYTLFFMNGCDTYAYVDDALFDAHAAVNEDDPAGTKYVDIINNAMPSYFFAMAPATLALVEALLNLDAPSSFEKIFSQIDSAQLVLVTGEEDNEFVPGPIQPEEQPQAWAGVDLTGTLLRTEEIHFETPLLYPGTYRFIMNGTGDADLYIRIGDVPTQQDFDCRPYKVGSDEVCSIEVDQPVRLFGMVRGWYEKSNFELLGGVLK